MHTTGHTHMWIYTHNSVSSCPHLHSLYAGLSVGRGLVLVIGVLLMAALPAVMLVVLANPSLGEASLGLAR